MDFKFITCVLCLQMVNQAWSQVPKPSKPYTMINGKPSFCKSNECPPFTVISTSNLYEERLYESSTWVEVEVNNVPYTQSKWMMFSKLFNYITGYNSGGMNIDMTAPVITKMISGQDNSQSYTMAFYISPSIVNPPAPRDQFVRVRTIPQFTAFVRAFPGRLRTLNEWLNQKNILEQALTYTGYDQSYFYTAGYDSPYVRSNRHNEVWLIKN